MSRATDSGRGMEEGNCSRPDRPLNIFVLGATGRSGRHLVASALAQGHRITGVVRNRQRLSAGWEGHAALTIIEGDIADPGTLRSSWSENAPDAVICMLSSEQAPFNAVSTATRAVLSALAAQKAACDQRATMPFISIASWGMGPTAPYVTHWGARSVIGVAKRSFWARPYKDFEAQFELAALGQREGLLTPTFIAPPILTDAPAGTHYLSGDAASMSAVMGVTKTVARGCIGDLAVKLAGRAASGQTLPNWVAIRDMPKSGRTPGVEPGLVTRRGSTLTSLSR